MRKIVFWIAGLLLMVQISISQAADNEVRREQVHGTYTNGYLVDPSELLLEGFGFIKIFRQRGHQFGADQLVDLIMKMSSKVKNAFSFSERLQIGDMSSEKGGQLGGHSSHQNGLDVDISYLRKDKREQDPWFTAGSKTGFDESFVDNSGFSKNFDVERNWFVLKEFVKTGKVQRIFVDGILKAGFCKYTKSKGIYEENIEVLRRLRAWPLHDDHMHVRMFCPAGSNACMVQEEPPAGSGCEDPTRLEKEEIH